MRGVGFEPTTSQSDLRKSKRKKKCEASESNPRPLGSEGESKEMKEKRREAWEQNPRPHRQIQAEN